RFVDLVEAADAFGPGRIDAQHVDRPGLDQPLIVRDRILALAGADRHIDGSLERPVVVDARGIERLFDPADIIFGHAPDGVDSGLAIPADPVADIDDNVEIW